MGITTMDITTIIRTVIIGGIIRTIAITIIIGRIVTERDRLFRFNLYGSHLPHREGRNR